jgi:hypothetical protein
MNEYAKRISYERCVADATGGNGQFFQESHINDLPTNVVRVLASCLSLNNKCSGNNPRSIRRYRKKFIEELRKWRSNYPMDTRVARELEHKLTREELRYFGLLEIIYAAKSNARRNHQFAAAISYAEHFPQSGECTFSYIPVHRIFSPEFAYLIEIHYN